MIKQQIVKSDSIAPFFSEYHKQGIACNILSIQPFAFIEDELEEFDNEGNVNGKRDCWIVDAYLIVYIPTKIDDLKKMQQGGVSPNIVIPNIKLKQ